MTADTPRTFYRVIRRRVPGRIDFTSNTAKGRQPPRTDPETLQLWDGVSVYDDLATARERARALPGMGRFLAAVLIEPGAPLRVAKTLRDPHHYTVWGEPGALVARVVSVVPV